MRVDSMRKLYMFNLMTLDGFFSGPNGEIDWHNVDAEFHEFAVAQLGNTDTILFGRKTYELMAEFWPTEQAIEMDPIIAGIMNSIAKVVFSTTVSRSEWNNSRVAGRNIIQEIKSLKETPGKDIAIFGSANLCASLIDEGLIDEFRILINPVVLREGVPLFHNLKSPLKLTLVAARTFASGNVLVIYQPLK